MRNDLQIEMITFSKRRDGSAAFAVAGVVEYQHGRGEITLQSADPDIAPRIDNRFCEDERDRSRLVACFKDVLTFAKAGLHKIVDMGKWWRDQTGLPLPLGGNAIRRELGPELIAACCTALRDSIRYALDNREEALQYAMQFARDLDPQLADKFVGMYVNEWTLDYGPRGREAVRRLLEEAHRAGVIPAPVAVEFVE